MDAPELEEDVRVQRDSGQLLADFEQSLNPFLYNTTAHNAPIRRRVRLSETERLVSLLENFQELPQLLDSYLPRFVSTLADALLISISRKTSKLPSTNADLLMPLSRAICRLIYTFCKVRGEKVIVRFLSTEVRHVDLLLSAIEKGTIPNADEAWSWEERYVVLVWLSQLLLAPFDLVSMSADATVDGRQPEIAELELSANIPAVAMRAISISLRFLSASGKERESAKGLLVRVAIRRDVQDLDVLDKLVKWALSSLRDYKTGQSIHRYIGILSFLAGITKTSLNTSYMDQYLQVVFGGVRSLIDSAGKETSELYDSAVTRELCIKILRNITLLVLRNPDDDFVAEIVDDSIQYMFDCLGDGSTPVRLAASKAISRITLKLDVSMGEEMVSMICERLEHDIIWPTFLPRHQQHDRRISEANLDRVKPQEWHGLIMTLSQLLYHRSPPPDTLPDILAYLFIGLSFEQRDTLGSPIGANVRDAACFGLWAVARKYSTAELEAVTFKYLVNDVDIKNTTLQTLATHLVLAASLDPVGNIRRGSSAALQELIGRHPNTITKGIDHEGKDLITVVGYHAVALRSRAVSEVACGAAELSVQDYARPIMAALLSWRGVGDKSDRTRHLAAQAMGRIAFTSAPREQPEVWGHITSIIEEAQKKLMGLYTYQGDERHGLIHCIAALVSEMPGFEDNSQSLIQKSVGAHGAYSIFEKILTLVNEIIDTTSSLATNSAHLPEQQNDRIIGATVTLILHTFRIFCFSGLLLWLARFPTADKLPRFLSLDNTSKLLEAAYKDNCFTEHQVGLLGCASHLTALDASPLPGFLSKARKYFEDSLEDGSIEDTDLIRDCVRVIMIFSDKVDREAMALRWISNIPVGQGRHSSWKERKRGIFVVVWTVFAQEKYLQSQINTSIHDRWRSTNAYATAKYDLDTRVALLQYLAESDVLDNHWLEFGDMVEQGLDDYHSDPVRGDISSLVRIAAAKAVGRLWDRSSSRFSTAHRMGDMALGRPNSEPIHTSTVLGRILRLCVERLDNVRAEGRKAIVPLLRPSPETSIFVETSVTSYDYFLHILNLGKDMLSELGSESTWVDEVLFAGYVTSAAHGAQDVIRNSRAALLTYCEANPWNTDRVTKALYELLMEFRKKDDRVLIATLEIIAFLFDMRIMQKSKSIDFTKLYLQIQHSHYQSSNVKKIEAAIKCYGGLCEVLHKPPKKLFKILMHPYPSVRKLAADELYNMGGWVKTTNWTAAKKGEEDRVWEELEREGTWGRLIVKAGDVEVDGSK